MDRTGSVLAGDRISHRRYPFSEQRVPMYESSSFPNRCYGGPNDYLERKRKLDGYKAEPIGNRGYQTYGEPLTSPISQHPEQLWGSPAKSTHLAPSTPQKVKDNAPALRVRNIPVVFTNSSHSDAVKCAVVPEEGTKKSRKAMSVGRAAVLVQSWYRGHLVRETKLLLQLREIGQVRSKLREVERQMANMDFVEKVRQDSKVRVWLVESMMDLLFRLDAIQGAHSSVREIRKAVTKEIVRCQEAIDALPSGEKPSIETNIEQEEMLDSGSEAELDTVIQSVQQEKMAIGVEDHVIVIDIQEPEAFLDGLNTTTLVTDEEPEDYIVADCPPEESSIPSEDIFKGEDIKVNKVEPDPDQTTNGSGGDGEVLGGHTQSLMAVPEVPASGMTKVDTNETVLTDDGTEEGVSTVSNLDYNGGVWSRPSNVKALHIMMEVEKSDTDTDEQPLFEPNPPEAHPPTSTTEEQQHVMMSEDHKEIHTDFPSKITSEIGQELGRRGGDSSSDNVTVKPTDEMEGVPDEEMQDAAADNQICTTDGKDEANDLSEEKLTNSRLALHQFVMDSATTGSPKSPFEYESRGSSVSDGEQQHLPEGIVFEYVEEPEATRDESLMEKPLDNVVVSDTPEKPPKDLLTRLSEENQTLKALVIGLVRWNQVQANTMSQVVQRIDKLENLIQRMDKKPGQGPQ